MVNLKRQIYFLAQSQQILGLNNYRKLEKIHSIIRFVKTMYFLSISLHFDMFYVTCNKVLKLMKMHVKSNFMFTTLWVISHWKNGKLVANTDYQLDDDTKNLTSKIQNHYEKKFWPVWCWNFERFHEQWVSIMNLSWVLLMSGEMRIKYPNFFTNE